MTNNMKQKVQNVFKQIKNQIISTLYLGIKPTKVEFFLSGANRFPLLPVFNLSWAKHVPDL